MTYSSLYTVFPAFITFNHWRMNVILFDNFTEKLNRENKYNKDYRVYHNGMRIDNPYIEYKLDRENPEDL